ncbi:Ig-like domain-containing protein, partial [Halomonas sp. WWR20]
MANSPVGIYQAEDAELTAGAESTDSNHIQINNNQAGYEGDGFVDYGNGIDGGETITWTLGSDQTGEFDLAFRYALSTGSRPLLLAVNGGDPIPLDFTATGSASTWGTLVQRVTLSESEENVITLTSFENSGANIDQLEVLAVAEPDDDSAFTTPVGVYQAEDAELTAGAESTDSNHIQVNNNQAGYEGDGFVDYGNGIDGGETITWTIGSDQTGEFDLAFRYALTTGTRPLLLSVNGEEPITLDFAATGSATTWGTLTQRVALAGGQENVITLTSFENSGANIDQLEVLAVAEADGSADEDNNLALIALDSTIEGEEAQAVPFQVTGLDDDIETVEISFNDGARRAISLNTEDRFAIDLSSLADGDVTATLFVTDNAGNQATAATAFTLDTEPDDSSYTSPVGIYQAEDAALATGTESTTSNYIRVNDSQAGYEGEGYVDYGNGVDRGETITWTVGSDQTGEFDLAFRYALTTGTRPLLLNINGGETVTLDFSATGSATTWDTLTQRVTLAGGQENIITLTSFENSGANIDQLEILPISSAEDTTADKNGDLGLDVLDATIDTTEIAAVPFHISGLDADIKTIAVSFDDGETRLDVTPDTRGDFTLDLTGYGQGNHTATLYVTDEAGNEATTTTSVTIESEEADPGVEPANRFEVKINFQPAIDSAAYNPNFVTPEGYIADEGLAFGQQSVTVDGKAYQYGWVSEDSIADGTANGTTPLALKDQADLAVNDRTDDIEGLDPLQGTYAHFALPSYAENAGWEMELENGFYEVTLSIGDTSGAYDSHYVVNAEGELFNAPFTPFRPDDFPADSNPADDTEGFRSNLVTRIVEVTDGRLTLDSIGAGSSNTEIQYLEIRGLPDLTPDDERSAPEDYAYFTDPRAVSGVGANEIAIDLDPDNGSMPTGVGPDSDIFIGVSVVDGRGGTLLESLQDGSVRLFETVTGKEVAFNINTTGGFDSLTISPKDGLKEFTSYTIKIEGFQDRGDNDNPDAPTREFQTFTTTFVTGDAPESVAREVAFTKNVELDGSADDAYGFTSVELSPDGSKLYIATMAGEIKRYDVDPDTGSLSGEQTLTLDYFQDADGPRGIIGLTFDPNDPNTLWVTDNYPIPLSGRSESVPDFSGRITKITLGDGPEFAATAEPYITGLPRSVADHVTNSLEFRVNPEYDAVNNPDVPTHLLYVIQGSDSAMGEPDSAWGSRPERLLNAAVLEIDPTRTPPEGGFDVTTEPLPDNGRRYADDDNDLKNGPIPMEDGEYLVFAENGTATVQSDDGDILEQFYNPYADDAVLKIFATGIRNGYDLVWHSNGQLYVPTNGSAAGGSVPDDPSTLVDESQDNVSKQDDYLFTVEEGGYYGHPNPLHDQYVMNGGNPTSAEDVNQVDDYPVGQEPDPNYRIEDAYSLGENRSPNGATEYTSDVFGSSLQHNLLFTEYSGGDDIRSITLDEDGNIIGDDVLRDINGNVIRYVDSLDIIENPATGQLYLLTLNRNNGQSQLIRLDPAPGGVITDPTGGDEDGRVSILTIQAEDNTPDDGTSVAIADADIEIRNESNPESSGLRPGAYGLDGNTNNSDGVMGGYADFGSTNDDFITFTFELTEAQAGESVLQVRYANGGATSRPLEAVINQESAGTFAFNPPAGVTGDAAWSTWQLIDIPADLVAGVNTVTFQATSGTGPNIDQLEILQVPQDNEPGDGDGEQDGLTSILTLQAEDNTPDDGTSVTIADADIEIRNESNPESSGLRPGAYGLDGNTNDSDGVMGGYADFGSTNDDFITFTFELTEAQAGAAILQVRYANGGSADRPLEALVNQTSVGTFAFSPPAGATGEAAWNTWQLVDIPADLVAGTNTVTFQAIAGTGPNIDQLEIFAAEASDDSADTDNNLALAALDTVLEGDEAETATFQVSGLDDDIETLEVSFNDGERITVVP